MDHTELDQSYGDELMQQMPETSNMLRTMGIQKTHTRLRIQAEASSLATDEILAAMELKIRRIKPRTMPGSMN